MKIGGWFRKIVKKKANQNEPEQNRPPKQNGHNE